MAKSTDQIPPNGWLRAWCSAQLGPSDIRPVTAAPVAIPALELPATAPALPIAPLLRCGLRSRCCCGLRSRCCCCCCCCSLLSQCCCGLRSRCCFCCCCCSLHSLQCHGSHRWPAAAPAASPAAAARCSSGPPEHGLSSCLMQSLLLV